MRGLSAIAVAFCHCVAGSTQIGGYAVNFFFALSGFLVIGILHQGRHRIDAGERSVSNELWSFWKRRAARIFPAYYVIAAIVLSILVAYGRMHAGAVVYFLVYVQNAYMAAIGEFPPFGYTWTLAVEQQFYILFAPLLLIVASRFHMHLLAVLWGGLVLAVVVALCARVEVFALLLSPLVGFALASAGGLLAITGANPRRVVPPWIIGGAFLSILPLACLPNAWSAAHPAFNIAQTVFCAIAIPGLIAFIAQNPASVATVVLEHRALRFFGAISYSLYLIHGALVQVIKPVWPVLHAGPPWLSFALSRLSLFAAIMTISTVLAYLSYIFLEQRFTSRGRPPEEMLASTRRRRRSSVLRPSFRPPWS